MRDELTGWSRNRWVFTILFLFVVHIVALQLLKSRPSVELSASRPKMDVRVLNDHREVDLVDKYLNTDPTLFVLANARSFSGVGWLASSQSNSDLPDWIAPSAFLPYTQVPVPVQPADEAHFLLSKLNHPPAQQPFHALSPGESVRTNSVMSLRGPITNLSLLVLPALPTFPASTLTSNTIVEISADRDGQVVLNRLLVKSGIPAADDFALSTSRRLIFDPPGKEKFAGNELISGSVIFHWKAYYSTNAPLGVTP